MVFVRVNGNYVKGTIKEAIVKDNIEKFVVVLLDGSQVIVTKKDLMECDN